MKVIIGGFMTKLDFAIKLEQYNKKQNMEKWLFFFSGIIFIIFLFIPHIIFYLDEYSFVLNSNTLPIFAGICLGKASLIKRGTEEHELLINALDLLSANNDT
jgi:hypothetical protein